MAAKSGKDGSFKVATVSIGVEDWEFNGKANTPDVTDSLTAADVESHVVGRKGATFTVKGPVNFAASQTTTLAAGTVISTVELIANGSQKYAIPSATVQTIRVSTPIKTGDPVMYEATCLVNGVWTEMA